MEEIEAAFSSTTVVLDHPSLPLTQSIGKKKSAGKKTKHHPKVKKQPFDQCLFEVRGPLTTTLRVKDLPPSLC